MLIASLGLLMRVVASWGAHIRGSGSFGLGVRVSASAAPLAANSGLAARNCRNLRRLLISVDMALPRMFWLIHSCGGRLQAGILAGRRDKINQLRSYRCRFV